MIIVAGWLKLKPGTCDQFLAASMEAMVLARRTPGCRAFVVAADPIATNLVNVYESWDTEADLLAFREDGPSADLGDLIVGSDVSRYHIAGSGPA